MIRNIKKYTKSPLIAILSIMLPLGGVGGLTSCSDLRDTKSDMIEFAEDNKLNSAQDTLSSMLGVIRGIQTIADRTIILGDVRSDQLTPTEYASTAIQQLASFQVPSSYICT